MSVFIKIVDNKKVSFSQAEWEMYESICRAYDRPNFKGEELFKDLFESDENGVITYLKPPRSRFTSMEVFLFLVCLFEHQHMRQMYSELRNAIKDIKK